MYNYVQTFYNIYFVNINQFKNKQPQTIGKWILEICTGYYETVDLSVSLNVKVVMVLWNTFPPPPLSKWCILVRHTPIATSWVFPV